MGTIDRGSENLAIFPKRTKEESAFQNFKYCPKTKLDKGLKGKEKFNVLSETEKKMDKTKLIMLAKTIKGQLEKGPIWT